MRTLILVSLVFISCKDEGLMKSFDPRCNQPCYTGAAINAGVGVCSMGQYLCDSPESEPVCVGSILPQERACNGLDNNCDGQLDDLIRTCVGGCGETGYQTCNGNTWNECSAKSPTVEICNGIDDDCNGIVDDVTYTDPYCYTGPADTVGKGSCAPGFWQCSNGVKTCANEVLPKPETCNQIDDNCNGVVDEGTTVKPKDIVVCMDESGSMQDVITRLQAATNFWASRYAGRPDLKFALESCPGHNYLEDNQVLLRQNFTDASTFNRALSLLFAGDTGTEPTIDAIYLTAEPNGPLRLTWRSDADKIFIMFTDEVAQSGFVYPLVSIEDAANMSADAGMAVTLFLDQEAAASSFDAVTSLPGNQSFDIYMTTLQLEAALNTIINPCH